MAAAERDVVMLPSAAAAPHGPPPLSEVIERLGFGWAQLRCAVFGGAVFLADGAELLLIGAVTRAVSKEWGMRAWGRGAVVSIDFVGVLIGNAVSGPFGDSFGRRLPIIMSYAGIAIFSLISAMTHSFYQLSAARLFVGIAFGFGQPVAIAQCTEVTPVAWRTVVQTVVQASFIAGELYSAMLIWYDDPWMNFLDWRWLLLMGALPSVAFLALSLRFLPQSPSYLATNGEYNEALKVLEHMRQDNGLGDDVSVKFRGVPLREPRTPMRAIVEPMQVVFSLRMLYATCVSIYSCLVLNATFYGCLYAFPQVVADVDMGSSPAAALVMGALWEIPGAALAFVCGLFVPTRVVILMSLLLMLASMLAFTTGAEAHLVAATRETEPSATSSALLHGGYMGVKAFTYVGFVAVYTFASEIYPTRARATGSAASVAGGRIGGMVAPLLFEELSDRTGSFSAFFHLMAAMIALNFVVLLPVGSHDHEDSDTESAPLVAKP